jgi:hypothetical protein
MGETRNSYRILMGKPEGKRPLAANFAAIQELPSIYETRRFITVLTRVLHWSPF